MPRNFWNHSGIIIFALFFLSISHRQSCAAPAEVMLDIPTQVSSKSKISGTLSIKIPSEQIGGFEISLTFDPTFLTIESESDIMFVIPTDETFSNASAGTFLCVSNLTYSVQPNAQTVKLACITTFGGSAGTIPVATINFLANGIRTGQTKIQITPAEFTKPLNPTITDVPQPAPLSEPPAAKTVDIDVLPAKPLNFILVGIN